MTISVDDGHPADRRAAELLEKLGYTATFYVPAHNPERPVMAPRDVATLAQNFEVGGHTYNHRPLVGLNEAHARREIVDGKNWLEDVIGHPARAFCYPRGKFNKRLTQLVREAGFALGRTTMGNLVDRTNDPYRLGTTTQAYSHTRLIHFRHAALEGNWRGSANYLGIFRLTTDWVQHFERAVAFVSEQGGLAHLWLHSWELEAQDGWPRLEALLVRLRSRYAFESVTNGSLFPDGHAVPVRDET